MHESAILTIQAASPGGVPSLVKVLAGRIKAWGDDPTIYRAHFAPGDLSLLERIQITWRTRRPQTIDERGHRTTIVPAPPLPLWLFYLVPPFLTGPLLRRYSGIFVASGSAHVALPLALRGKPYVLWVATLYEDELRAKANVDDAWAQQVLNSPTWPVLAWQERLTLRRAERVLALSYHTAERIRAVVPEATVETVLYPIDTDRFHPDPAVEMPYGRYLFLAARINDPRKNVPTLLRAFARVLVYHPDVMLVMVGEEPGAPLLALVDELGIAQSVVMPGVVSFDELVRLYQGAAMFTFPSIQEGLGISAMEAMACGTPVVAMKSGGPEGIVIEGETGRMVDDPHDAEAFAAAILDLLNNPATRAQMSTACVQFARHHYEQSVVHAKLHDAYRLLQQQG